MKTDKNATQLDNPNNPEIIHLPPEFGTDKEHDLTDPCQNCPKVKELQAKNDELQERIYDLEFEVENPND